MSASEDYLDQLLNGMIEEEEEERAAAAAASETPSADSFAAELSGGEELSDDDLLRQFDEDIAGGSDDFLSDFEKELSDDGDDPLALSEESGDDPFDFQNLDDLINLSRAETDDSIETMQPTTSRTSDENFNLGSDEEEAPEEKPEAEAAPETPPDSIPENILDLLESVPEELKDAPPEWGQPEPLEASAADMNDLPIEAYEGTGEEAADAEGLDNPAHVKKNAPEEADQEPDGEIEIPDPDAIKAAAAAESGIQDESALEAAGDDGDDELLAMLSGLDDEGGELSDIGDLLNKDAAGVQELTPEEIENLQDELDAPPEDGEREKLEGKFHTKKARKKEKRKTGNRGGRGDTEDGREKKPGFLARLLALLFSEADDAIDEQNVAEIAQAGAQVAEEIDDENLAILRELDAAGEGDNGTAPADDKKKKKKEKKEKKPKKEKPPKEPKPKKPPKPKKEKKPKVKDNTPPMPKRPVIVVAIFAISILALILLTTKLFGVSGSVDDAKKYYEEGNYVAAFTELNGMDLSGDDAEFFAKATVLASIQKPYEDYAVLFGMGKYDMALDSILRALGRCYNYEERAQELAIADTLARLKDQIAGDLTGAFGLSLEEAKEVYDARDREEYSLRIYELLERLGLSTGEGD